VNEFTQFGNLEDPISIKIPPPFYPDKKSLPSDALIARNGVGIAICAIKILKKEQISDDSEDRGS